MTNQWQRWKGIMKCYPFEEKRLAKWKPPFIVQPKYDGVRCRAIPLENGKYILLSSEENVIFSVPHINEILEKLRLTAELDGELYRHGMSFEEITSITSRTVNIHPGYKQMRFHIFDVVNAQPQMQRTLVIENLRGISPLLEVAPFWLCESLDDVMRVYDKLIEMNYEGIIVRHNLAPYERKRSALVMKFKPKKEDVYRITGWKEEFTISGEPKGRIGAIICKSQDGDEFSVGSGLTDIDREALWLIRESLKGQQIKVQYQHITSGKKVPRFPVFVEVIEDVQ